jgi:hypothetical protein
MQKELDRLDEVIISHDKRLTTIERVMWVCLGLGINNLPILELIK